MTDPAPPETATVGDEAQPTSVEDGTASCVVVSYPSDLSRWGRFQVEKSAFRAYLRKTRDVAREGDVWKEFVGVGCCGSNLHVPLRVERVDGGLHVDEETEIVYEVRDSCEIDGYWGVQDAAAKK